MSNVIYNFTNIEGFIGKAIKIIDKSEVTIENLEFDKSSMTKIEDIINNRINDNIVEVLISELYISKKDYTTFSENQTNYNANNRCLSITGTPSNHTRFVCELETSFKCSDGYIYGAKLYIPSIEFIISDLIPAFIDDMVVYSCVTARVYGKCQFTLIDEDR